MEDVDNEKVIYRASETNSATNESHLFSSNDNITSSSSELPKNNSHTNKPQAESEKNKIYTVLMNKSMVIGFIKNNSFMDEKTLQNQNAVKYIDKNRTFNYYTIDGKIGIGYSPRYKMAIDLVQGGF